MKIRCPGRLWPDGRVDFPHGEPPIGRITYDKAGPMSAQLMTPGRKTTVPSGMNLAFGKPSDEELRQAALVPSWVGPRTKRIWQREAY